MVDLKKLAAEIRKAEGGLYHHWADALDAYADAQKPVAWRTKKREWDNGGLKRYYVCSESCGDGKSPFREGAGEPLYAAPPLPSVSREKLREALRNNHSPDVSPEDIVEMALRALGINVTEETK